MKNAMLMSLALGGAASLALSVGASTCSAQLATVAPPTACASHTPARDSATRKQIADALRRHVGKMSSLYVVFVFDWLKVDGNWAYAQTRPESPDGQSHYEPVSALLRRKDGLWSVAAPVVADDETSPAQALRQVRKRFPNAPRDIFPR